MSKAIYVHIPFCLNKCPYCSFTSFPIVNQEVHDSYIDCVVKELEIKNNQNYFSKGDVSSIFIGGGTPTILSNENLEKLCKSLPVSDDLEVTIEANPKTVDFEKLKFLQEIGINRLSIGVQSFSDDDLRNLSRPYSKKDVEEIVEFALVAGFDNLSLDLMYGLPGHTPEKWQEVLTKALSYNVKHLSIYQLTIEPNTPFEKRIKNNDLFLPEESVIDEIDELTLSLTEKASLQRYEISNYAKAGYQSLHNKNYWHNESYVGVGAAAVEFIDGQRRWNETSPEKYIKRILSDDSCVTNTETLTKEESFRETVVMGLRMLDGISVVDLEERYGINVEKYYGADLTKLINIGVIQKNKGQLSLTSSGLRLANSVMAELV